MPKIIKSLNNKQIESAKPAEKEYSLSDGQGLYLLVKPNGSKIWRFNYYRPNGKRALLSLGDYPSVSLKEAREVRSAFKEQLAKGIDPQQQRLQAQKALLIAESNTFEKIAMAWFEWRKERANFSAVTQRDVQGLLKRHLLPAFAEMPISSISAPMVIKAFEPLQKAGKLETVRRLVQKMNEIMTYALHRDLITHNPLVKISVEYDAPAVTHQPTIKPDELGNFLKALINANIFLQTRYLILWQLLTLTRPSEASNARYEDIDEEKHIWTIYIQKGLKEDGKSREHKITLSKQALALLQSIKQLSGESAYLFPSVKTPFSPAHSQSANMAIKRMGYGGRLVAHGLRSIASTWLNEQGFNVDLIEVALSHINQDRIRMAYNRAEYLEKRFLMLQAWADFVEQSAGAIFPVLITPFR